LCFLLWKTWKNQGISLWSEGNNPVEITFFFTAKYR